MILAFIDTDWMILLCWMILAVILAYKIESPKIVYWISVLLAAAGVFYIQYTTHHYMEMGGIFHALIAGLYPLLLFYLFRYIKHARK